MSNMLEQAIIDATNLRSAAIKNAEAVIVEKYASEVKEAVDSILEQEIGERFRRARMVESDVVEDIPAAYDPEVEEDDIVVVDLDQIIAAADADEGVEDDNFELDAEEIADEIGIPLDEPQMASAEMEPGNRDDDEEVEINEGELVELKELLVVDMSEEELMKQKKSLRKRRRKRRIAVASSRNDGYDQKDIKNIQELLTVSNWRWKT